MLAARTAPAPRLADDCEPASRARNKKTTRQSASLKEPNERACSGRSHPRLFKKGQQSLRRGIDDTQRLHGQLLLHLQGYQTGAFAR